MYPWSVCKWRISPFEWMEDKQVEKPKYRCVAATAINVGLSSLNLLEYSDELPIKM